MKIRKTLLVLATGVMMTGILTACGSSGKTVTIDMADYIDISVSGYDSYGVLEYSFDKDRLMSDHGDDISYSKSLKSEAKKMSDKDRADYIVNDDSIKLSNLAVIASMDGANASKVAKASSDSSAKLLSGLISAEVENLARYTPDDMFGRFVGCEVSDTEGLSNGDTVTINVKSAEELEDKFNVKFENSVIEYTVDSLDEPVEVDPFDYFDISYSGKNSSGKYDYETTLPEDLKSINFNFVWDDGEFHMYGSGFLSNGDTFTVVAKADEQKLGEMGYKLTCTEKQYVVDGLSYYIESSSDIPEADLVKMQDKAVEYISSKLNSNLALTSIDYVGNYFLRNSNPDGFFLTNMIYLVYKVNVYNPTNNAGPVSADGYVAVRFGDLMMTGDGTLSYNLDNPYQPGHSVSVGNRTFTGYESLESAYDDLVAGNSGYICENNVSQS